jgi:serine/threonine protein phosphatase PrpC
MKPVKTIEPRHADRPGTGVRVSADSHPGLQRDHNEDRFHYDVARGIFLVVDGVGGHAAGDKAAETAITVLRERLERETGNVEDRIREAIALANNNIHRLASWKPEWRGMGCVLTVAVVANGRAVVGHVGDTRLYKMRGGHLEKVTRDHSPVGEREDAHELSEAEAMRHPRRNEVYRDVGSEPHEPGDPGFVDIFTVPFEPDAALLLCSDGLSDTVSSSTIAEVVRAYAGHPYEVVRALIDAANESGGKDNVTVVYVEGEDFSRAQLSLPLAGPVRFPGVESHPVPLQSASRRGRRWRTITLIVLVLAVATAAAVLLMKQWGGSLPALPFLTRSPIINVNQSQSIAAAIERAGPGSTIVVEPGEYREQVRLKTGVRIRSRVPRGASIRLRGDASETDPAVVAVDVADAELAGFRIVGDAATPLGSGIYVRDADVWLTDLEVTGAAIAAVELVSGAGASVTAADIHDNPGSGLVIRAGASPRIVHSQFVRNGGSERAAAAPVLIEPGARPRLSSNVFQGLTPDLLTGLSQAEREAVRHSNWFVGSEGGRSALPSPQGRAPQGRR